MENKILLKIKNNAADLYKQNRTIEGRLIQFNQNWYDKMKSIQGEFLELDTEFLFDNQYNTKKSKYSDVGLRIMDYMVEYILLELKGYRVKFNYPFIEILELKTGEILKANYHWNNKGNKLEMLEKLAKYEIIEQIKKDYII